MTSEQAREKELARHLARALGLPFVDLDEYRISAGVLSKLPVGVIAENRCVPMVFNSRRVVLLIDEPSRMALISSRGRLPGVPSGRRFEFAITTASGLDAGIKRRRTLAR